MAEEEEVFEINDFSTSSEWERFIADLEEILTQWSLGSGSGIDEPSAIGAGGQETSILKATNVSMTSSHLLTDPKLWVHKQEQLKFGKVEFVLTYRAFQPSKKNSPLSVNVSTSSSSSSGASPSSGISRAWLDMNNLDHDWTVSGHRLVRYYGLTQFLLLTCSKTELIDTEDRIRHLIGSAIIALKNISCEVPFFVQICQLHRQLFSGVHVLNSGFRTHFEMIQFPEVPASFQYLAELMALYKKKLHSSFSYTSRPFNSSSPSNSPAHHSPFADTTTKKSSTSSVESRIQISVRFTYLLGSWPPQYLLFNGPSPAHPALERFSYLARTNKPRSVTLSPCTTQHVSQLSLDPVVQLQLATTWPSVAEELIVDNAYHTDLQPRSAPKWSLRAVFTELAQLHHQPKNLKLCHTTQWLRTFLSLKLKFHTKMLAQFCASHASSQPESLMDESELDFRSALDRLSSPAERVLSSTTENLEDWLRSDTNLRSNLPAIQQSILEHVRAIFEQPSNLQSYAEEEKTFGSFLSSPIGSLSWQISLLLANCFAEDSQISSLAQCWKVIVEKLRDAWEKGELLPNLCTNGESGVQSSTGVSTSVGDCGTIDFGHCLFHQKLQMLNACIGQKIKREHRQQTAEMIDGCTKLDQTVIEEKEDDEFYDCESEEDPASISTPVDENKPEGQAGELRDANGQVQYRLDQPKVAIFVPFTQDPAPMTEDQHQQHIQIIGSLSSSAEDTKIKIRMQSGGLLSDMEAFKAANPNVGFEDFIRWHSPRDWVQLDNGNLGEYGLSRRMKESTLWAEIWSIARAVPISRQTRLFNYTKEAEEILHLFESISVEKLVTLLSPILIKATLRHLLEYRREIFDFIDENIVDRDAGTISKDFLALDLQALEAMFNRSDQENLLEEFSYMELIVARFLSILKKLIFAYESDVKKPFFDLQSTEKSAAKAAPTRRIGTARITPSAFNKSDIITFATRLVLEPDVEFASANSMASLIVRLFADGNRFDYENRTTIGERLPVDANEASEVGKRPAMATIPQLPAPNGKEFILRAPAFCRPAPYSRPSSQRFYALLLPGNDFRIASAFTEDTLYF